MPEHTQKRPNIVFLLPDQQRADFLSCYGADFIRTPNIDRIAERGVIFTQAYSPHPLCVPARVALMTGMNAIKTGVLHNMNFLRPDYAKRGIRTLPELLSEQGYYTAAIGKMHFYPWDLRLGFQYRVIAEDKRWVHIRDDYYQHLKEHGYKKLHGNEHPGYCEHKGAIHSQIPLEHSVDRFVGDEACKFLRHYGQEEPFFMMVGFPGPHCPYDPVKEMADRFDPADMPEPIVDPCVNTPKLIDSNIQSNKRPWNGVDYEDFSVEQRKKIRAHYAASVKQIDLEVGKILDTLEEQGLAENTIIAYSADHGDYLGDHNMMGKGSFYQSSIHVPLILHAPGMEKAERSESLVHLDDITPTLLAAAGCELRADMDSRPLPLPGDETAVEREYAIGMVSDGWMVYDGEWRLAKYSTGETVLFNLKDDPQELTNRLHDADCREIYDRLDRELATAILNAINAANADCRVYSLSKGLSQEPTFGLEGWQRPYPAPFPSSSPSFPPFFPPPRPPFLNDRSR